MINQCFYFENKKQTYLQYILLDTAVWTDLVPLTEFASRDALLAESLVGYETKIGPPSSVHHGRYRLGLVVRCKLLVFNLFFKLF